MVGNLSGWVGIYLFDFFQYLLVLVIILFFWKFGRPPGVGGLVNLCGYNLGISLGI